MAKLQTRRSVSISAEQYARLREYSKDRKVSMSRVVEHALNLLLGGKIVKTNQQKSKKEPKTTEVPTPKLPNPVASFTF